MRVAALYDVHGNLPALTAVLAEVDALAIDMIVTGGDVASGPMPVETLDTLRARGARFVRGNADRVLDLRGVDEGDVWVQARRWVAARLGEERLAFLAALPVDLTLDLPGLGPVRFCHGAPGSDELTITRLTPDARVRELLAGVDERVVVCGHTHVQFDRTLPSGLRVVNAGSVGMPYQGEQGAYWALLGSVVDLRRTVYDVEAAAEVIRASDAQGSEQHAAWLVDPPDPDETTQLFGSRRKR
jgi:diadenosine tetraphosphatase ApaH/serine/threonine PP2A family protein phosphatase